MPLAGVHDILGRKRTPGRGDRRIWTEQVLKSASNERHTNTIANAFGFTTQVAVGLDETYGALIGMIVIKCFFMFGVSCKQIASRVMRTLRVDVAIGSADRIQLQQLAHSLNDTLGLRS
uniref:Uncharacterized protein n=1 Tax=Anopheles culicifacies TaxID=139723 RepID=A0A182LZ00_9DIPT